MKFLAITLLTLLVILSLRGVRWAYLSFIVLGLLYFPVKVGFRLNPQPCEIMFSVRLAFHSLTNYPHIVLFALFAVMTIAQFRAYNWRVCVWTMVITIIMGVLVEVAESVTATGHCRSRDLIPDGAGSLIGLQMVWAYKKMRNAFIC